MDNLRGLIGIKRMGSVLNVQIRKVWRETKERGGDERIDQSVLWWFSHIERMGDNRIAKMVYVGVHTGSQLVGQKLKKWIDFVNECLKKRGLNAGKTRRKVYDKYEWWGFEEYLGHSPIEHLS